MYEATRTALRAAEAFEKMAQYFDAVEQAETEKKAQELRTDFIDPIMQRTGHTDVKLSEKLAKADPDILTLLKTMSETPVEKVAADTSLGGPTDRNDPSSSDPFLAFLMSDD